MAIAVGKPRSARMGLCLALHCTSVHVNKLRKHSSETIRSARKPRRSSDMVFTWLPSPCSLRAGLK